MLEGREIDNIIKDIPSGRVRKKADQIKEAIENNLDSGTVFLIENSLDLMKHVQDKIEAIDVDLRRKISTRRDDLNIVLSVPGIEFTSATTILAEMGDYRNFDTPEKLASYFGIVPYVKLINLQASSIQEALPNMVQNIYGGF